MDSGGAGRRLVIDHLEGDLAVVTSGEGGPPFDLPRWMLPDGAREGDVLVALPRPGADGAVTVELRVDRAASAERTREAAARLERLRGRDPGEGPLL